MSQTKNTPSKLWIASFPRSGNTFFRNVLHRVYGIASEEFFNPADEGNQEIASDFSSFRAIKTHLLPHQLPSPYSLEDGHVAVYLIRDGRDVLTSAAHHRKSWAAPYSDFDVNLCEAIVAPGDSFFGGGWSQHVAKWTQAAQVIIRFEDLIEDPVGEIERLRLFFDMPEPRMDQVPTFEQLRSGDADYGNYEISSNQNLSPREFAEQNFRRGKVGSWRDEMPSEYHELFWILHGETMDEWGYGRGERPSLARKKETPLNVALQIGNLEDPARDGTWRYTIELLNGLHALEQKMPHHIKADCLLKNAEVLPLQAYQKDRENFYECLERQRQSAHSDLRSVSPVPEGTAERNAREAMWRKWLIEIPHKIWDQVPGAAGRMLQGAWKGPVLTQIGYKLEMAWNKRRRPADIEEFEWDVLHLMMPQWAPASAEIRSRWLITYHDMTDRLFPEHHVEENIEMAQRGMRLAELRQAEFMAISGSTRNDLIDRAGIPPERVHLALEGANWDLFKPISERGRWEDVAAKLNLDPERPFFLVLNTLEPRKNLEGTMDGFLRFLEMSGAEVDLVVSGKIGWNMDHLAEDDRRNHPNIRFVGFVDDPDLPVLYSNAIALCYLSYYEGFGLPPLEAMCCRTPVIVSNVSSMPEVAGDGGLLVHPRDTEAIAEAMHRLQADPDLRAVLAEKAFVQAHRFNWLKMAWLTIRTYLEMVEERRN